MQSKALEKPVITAANTSWLSQDFRIVSTIYNRQFWAPKPFRKPHWNFDKNIIKVITHIMMHKSFINFRYIGNYTNRPVVSFFCRFVLPICRDDFSTFKTFRKNTNGDTIIIVISFTGVKTSLNFLMYLVGI